MGAMKIPTGGFGDYSITVGSIGDFIIDTFNLATKDYVDTLLLEKEGRIDTTGVFLTPVSQNSSVPDTTNDVIDEVAQALLNRIEYVKDNFSAAPSHNELTGRSASGAHPSTSISHKSGTVYTYLSNVESDINTINNVTIPTINQSIGLKQDQITTTGTLTGTPEETGINSVSHVGINGALQGLLNRILFNKNHSNLTNRSDENSHPSSAIQDGQETQKIINDKNIRKLDSISDLETYNPRTNYQVVYVKSYSSSTNFGGGHFVFLANDTTTTNGVNVFSAIGGRWQRLNWKNPTIHDVGLVGNESDATLKFQALVDAASNLKLKVNLLGKSIKITKLDIPSDMYLFNGTLDATSSTWQNTYGRAALMLKNTDRNAVGVDYEISEYYAPLSTIENITFEDITFKAITLIGIFFKFKNLNYIRCKGYWTQQNLFKFIGGWNGTPLVNDTPTSYNLVDPINGRCEYINIHDCYWFGGYTNNDFSSPFRFIACGKVNISGGINDSPLGFHIDIYNKDFTLTNADYINSNDQIVIDVANGTAHPDMMALYVGQNSYNINVFGGSWRNFGKKAAYLECCSKVNINGVIAEVTVDNNVASFIDLQPNWKNNTNTIWGNVSDITVNNCTSKGTKYGIQCNPYQGVKSLRNIYITDNNIITYSVFESVTLIGVENYIIKNNNCKGSLFIGQNNTKGEIINSKFYNQSNFALYISDQVDGELPKLLNNSFIVDSGSTIYNNGGSSKSGSIVGGILKSGAGSTIMELGVAANLVAYDFENGITQRTQNFSQNINVPANSTSSTITKTIDGVKEGWIASINVHGIVALGYDLTFIVSCENNGIAFKVKNNSSTAVNFNPNLLLRLNSFADQVFKN
ncbi:tail spike protein [Acinetobacter phage vB_AbaM_B9]|nr:tail spike protein [Acinetobacter phage vB_AbaM_B9]